MSRRRYETVRTAEQLSRLADELARSDVVALDTETTGLDVHAPGFQLVGVSISGDGQTGYYVPVAHESFLGLDYQPPNVPIEAVRDALWRIFTSTRTVMHNAAYDRPVLKRTLDLDFDYTRCEDTKLALHLINENGKQSLKDRAREFLGVKEVKKKFSDLRPHHEAEWTEAIIVHEKVDAVSAKTGRRYKKNVYRLKDGWVDELTRRWRLANTGAEPLSYVFDYWRGLMAFLRRKGIVDYEGTVPADFRLIPVGIATFYAGDDAINTWQLWQVAERKMREEDVERLYRTVELPVDDVMMRATWKGMRFNAEYFERMRVMLEERLEEATRDALSHAALLVDRHKLLNGTYKLDTLLGSSHQLQQLLFTDVGFTPVEYTDTGAPSVNADVLDALLRQTPKRAEVTDEAHAFIRAKQRIADIQKILSTYVVGIPQLADQNGLIHPQFNVTGTVSGRMSSNSPNWQNMPRLLEEELEERPWLEGVDIRAGFEAPPGWVFVDMDYSSMEMVVCAALSQDENMIRLLEEGRDMHAYTARHAFNVGWELTDAEFKKVYKVERQAAKVVNFAIIYGGTEYTLMQRFKYTEDQARALIDGYFKAYPGVKRWMEEVYATLEREGQVRYPEYGYVKRMDIVAPRTWEERRQYRAALRSCQNALIQGYSAFIVKDAIVQVDRELRRRGLRAYVAFQIHDEIGCLAPEEEAAEVFDIMRSVMTRDVNGVTLRADGEVKRSMSKNASPIDLLDLAA